VKAKLVALAAAGSLREFLARFFFVDHGKFNQLEIGNSDKIASTRRRRCHQPQIGNWKTQILRDILTANFW
jgi:hypothetical protein